MDFVSYEHTAFYFKTLIDGLKLCGLFVDCDVFIRRLVWQHPFAAKDPLVSKRYNAKFLQICSDEEKTQLHLIWPQYIFRTLHFFVWIIPLSVVL